MPNEANFKEYVIAQCDSCDYIFLGELLGHSSVFFVKSINYREHVPHYFAGDINARDTTRGPTYWQRGTYKILDAPDLLAMAILELL